MKKLILIFTAVLAFQLSNGQTLVKRDSIYPAVDSAMIQQKKQNEVKTLFHKEKGYGGYFGFSVGYTNIEGRDAVVGSARFMFVANHYLGIGIGGKGFSSIPEENTYLYSGGYGGLYLEPVVWALKPVHVSFPMLIGGGGIYSEYTVYNPWEGYVYASTGFFIFEPGVSLVLNITKWFQIDLGTSYKFTSNVEGLLDRPENLLRGFNYEVTFKFGKF
jgi:hypothetical protein